MLIAEIPEELPHFELILSQREIDHWLLLSSLKSPSPDGPGFSPGFPASGLP